MLSSLVRRACGRKPSALFLVLLLAVAQQPSPVTAASILGNGPLADLFSGLASPSSFQQRLISLPSFGLVNRTTTVTTSPGAFVDLLNNPIFPGLLLELPTPLKDIITPPASTPTGSVLKDIMAPVPRNAAGAASAAQGVVGASLLTAAGVCIAVAGGLGTGYAGLSEALGLVNGVAGRVNLGLEYAKAGLSLRSDLVTARREYVKAFTQASGVVPTVVEQAAQIRKALTSGNFLTQLESLRTQLLTAKGTLDNIRNAAAAAAAAAGR